MENNLHPIFENIFSDFIRPADHQRQTKCTIIQDIDRAYYLYKGKHLSSKQFDYLYDQEIDQLYEAYNNTSKLSHP